MKISLIFAFEDERKGTCNTGADPGIRIKQAGTSRTESVAQPPLEPVTKTKKETAMPKMKTNRAAAKRFRKTASGKFKCGHAFKSHILTKKATKRKRNLRGTNHVRKEDAGRVARMMPYA